MSQPPSKPLPLDFGPRLAGGQRRYVLQKLLGQGAFGQVYLGLDRQLSETGHTAMVAIKILVAADRTPWARQRLIEEATKVRRINHRNVVLVLDRGVSEQDEEFIVYEYVDGGDLGEKLSQNSPIRSVHVAVQLLAQIAHGIQAAHSAGVIHCDLKPGNIMLTAAGEPKVTDFGIAVRTGDSYERDRDEMMRGGPVGTVAFISPEQYRGEEGALSIQSDIYALGSILFYSLTGKLPNGSTLSEIAAAHDLDSGRVHPPSARVLRSEVDRDLDSICQRAMALKPSERYSSAAALAEDLERWGRMEPIAWTNPGAVRTLRLWAGRKPALAATTAAIVVLAVASAAVALRLNAIANRNRLDAAIANIRLEQSQREETQKKAAQGELVAKLMTLKNQYHLNTEILPQIWLLEYVTGPKVLNLPNSQARLWENKVETLRWLVNDARTHNRANAMETLLWESALAFWLVSGGEYTQSQPLLDSNIARWSMRLEPEDPWLSDLKAISVCAQMNRILDEARLNPQSTDRSEAGQLQKTVAALRQIDHQTPADHRGTPLHVLVLTRLQDAYAPAGLNDPVKVQEFARAIAESTRSKPPSSATQPITSQKQP
jgi:hypothetical protein